jgi:hypothetical protein
MHRGSGGIFIFGASVFYGVACFYRLWTRGYYRHFVRLLAIAAAWGAFLAFGFWWSWSFEDRQQRIWALIPFAVQLPIVFFGGFALCRSAERVLEPTRFPPRKPSDIRRRLFGGLLTALAFGIWADGLVHPSGSHSFLLVAFMLYAGLFGVIYLLTGRRLNDLD